MAAIQREGEPRRPKIVYHHGWRKPTIIRAPIVGICTLIQLFFSAVDTIYCHQGDTLDYLMIARKIN